MGRVVIWRDKVDRDMFGLGIQSQHGYCAYAYIHIDGICDLFGETVLASAKQLIPGIHPVEVTLTLAFGETEAGR